MPNKEGPTVFLAIKSFFRTLKSEFSTYPKHLHFNKGKEVDSKSQQWLAKKGIKFTTSSPYIYKQNGLVERSIRVILDRLRATLQ